MLLKGVVETEEYRGDIILWYTPKESELWYGENGKIISAYRTELNGSLSDEYEFKNHRAKETFYTFKKMLSGCKPKNAFATISEHGAVIRNKFSNRSGGEFIVDKINNKVVSCGMQDGKKSLSLQMYKQENLLQGKIKGYIKVSKNIEYKETDEYEPVVRTIEEIALDEKKDISKLLKKKYYIVDDIKTAEKIFTFLESYDGKISFDVETTGTKINMFSKVNSKEQKILEEYNRGKEESETIRADRLVGFSFAWKEGEAFYFPVGHRKIKNLYADKEEEGYKETCWKVRKSISKRHKKTLGDIYNLIQASKDEELTPDVILMERCAYILENKNNIAQNSAFEKKMCLCYDIICRIIGDTMLQHQLLFKYRNGTQRGERSDLESLTKNYLGEDQLGLTDFFVDYKEDTTGTVRGAKNNKGKKSKIDFSYMGYEGTKLYAPADVDFTLRLNNIFDKELNENKSRLKYLYEIELKVSSAIAYMEFYGHRIDEAQIEREREKAQNKCTRLEYLIRKEAKINSIREQEVYSEIEAEIANYELAEKEIKKIKDENTIEYLKADKKLRDSNDKLNRLHNKLKLTISENSENELNLASPKQVSELIYDVLKVPAEIKDGLPNKSVAKSVLKQYLKLKGEDKTPKYPVVNMYSEWKALDTLVSKFFGKLTEFMYPGGFVFSSYGQITTATGRMSCSKPNAQQYPKSITKIVIPRGKATFCDIDYSQIEYRVMVALAKEQGLIEKLTNPDLDYHTLMAALMYNVPYARVTSDMRKEAKSFNFGIPYGMGPGSLAILLRGINDEETRAYAIEKTKDYFAGQPGVEALFEYVKELAQVNGYTCTDYYRERHYNFMSADGTGIDNERRSRALRQAGNAVIQGTAADIFKISTARVYNYIEKNGLLGKVFITNLVHDEILMEVDPSVMNVEKVFADIISLMQFDIEGYPPLYVGAGFGMSWATAKDKPAEIHPHLAADIVAEMKTSSIHEREWKTKEWLDYISNRILKYRVHRIRTFFEDKNNYGEEIDPVVAGLFTNVFGARYGVNPDSPTFMEEVLQHVIDEFDIKTDASKFKRVEAIEDEIEEEEYDDAEEVDETGESMDDLIEMRFQLKDDDTIYGISIQDIIKEFGYLVSKEKGICGIDCSELTMYQEKKISELIEEHRADVDEEGALRVVALTPSNSIIYSDMYVKNVDYSKLEKIVNSRKALV